MDEALNRLWRGLDLRRPFEFFEAWDVPLDVISKDKEVIVKASLPEIDPEKVEVSVEEGVLTIKGETIAEKEEKREDYYLKERRSGSFFRAVRLPDTVDAGKAKSSYSKGVLTITFPKVAARKAQKIKVEVETD
jgi:HSP20 family protein